MSPDFGEHSTDHGRDCDLCGESTSVTKTVKKQFFSYGEPGHTIDLSANVSVWRCSACGFEYTDSDAEDARHEAICHHLGVLTPHEIRNIRETYALSQALLAKLTGFGEASIKRWEAGLVIQNVSADRFLRLLQNRDVFQKLNSISVGSRIAEPDKRDKNFRFRTQLPEIVKKAAKKFELRA